MNGWIVAGRLAWFALVMIGFAFVGLMLLPCMAWDAATDHEHQGLADRLVWKFEDLAAFPAFLERHRS